MFSNSQFFDLVLRIVVLGPISLLWVVAVVRFVGLRSFSKMTAFDFIATVATGSLLASAATATGWGAFFQASGAILAILGTQLLLARLRVKLPFLSDTLENEPLLLMEDGVANEVNMRRSRVTEDDLRAKLREANVLELSEVRAVVLETTGDISVLHGKKLQPELLNSVRRS